MRGISGFMGTLYGTTEWIMRFSVINILWFVINLPISIIILVVYFNDSNDGLILNLLPLVAFNPYIIRP